MKFILQKVLGFALMLDVLFVHEYFNLADIYMVLPVAADNEYAGLACFSSVAGPPETQLILAAELVVFAVGFFLLFQPKSMPGYLKLIKP